MPKLSDGWDWPYIVYAGRTLLGYSVADVWQLTPRFLQSQLKVHYELQSKMWGGGSDDSDEKGSRVRKDTKVGYIDQVAW